MSDPFERMTESQFADVARYSNEQLLTAEIRVNNTVELALRAELAESRAQSQTMAAALDAAIEQNEPIEIGYNRPTQPHGFACRVCHRSPHAATPDAVIHLPRCWYGIARAARAQTVEVGHGHE